MRMDTPGEQKRAISMRWLQDALSKSDRTVRRYINKAQEMGLIQRNLRGYQTSTFSLNLSRIYDLHRRFVLLREAKSHAAQTWAQRFAEAAAAGVRLDTPAVPPIPLLVREVLGPRLAANLGVTPTRCWKLWSKDHRPSPAKWCEDWTRLLMAGLDAHNEAPDWLWNRDKWRRKVDACEEHEKRGGPQNVTPVHGAEMAFPPGSRVRVHGGHWDRDTSPQRALERLKCSDASLLLGLHPIADGYSERGYLRVTVEDPTLLAIADDLAEHLRDAMPGPVVLSW